MKLATTEPLRHPEPMAQVEDMCKVKDCPRAVHSKGFCRIHYQRDLRGLKGSQMKAPVRRTGLAKVGFIPRMEPEALETLEAEAKTLGLSTYELANQLLEVPHKLRSSLPALRVYAKAQDCTLAEAIVRLAVLGLGDEG